MLIRSTDEDQREVRDCYIGVGEERRRRERERGGRKLTLNLLLQSSDTSFVSLEQLMLLQQVSCEGGKEKWAERGEDTVKM